ncbi:hypothetical protein ACF1B0_35310, partial [Streptomyces anandii]|uniref:hypothetical protein n=1 Tax=Streptomyces anandii TaxID=285454 RepID=UPI003702D317
MPASAFAATPQTATHAMAPAHHGPAHPRGGGNVNVPVVNGGGTGGNVNVPVVNGGGTGGNVNVPVVNGGGTGGNVN